MDKVELTTPALEQGDESQVAELVEAAKPFEEWYTSIQQHFTVQTEIANETEGLAIGIGNNSLPVHRWYNLKEAYSAQLPMSVYKWMRSRYGHAPIELLDPFIGGGTTGVALAQERVRVTGVEYNPFIRFVAAAKASIARGRVVELKDAIRLLERAPLTPT